MSNLLDLPSEIFVFILHFLDLHSLISCIATNRRLKSIIDSSALLQFRLAAQAACVDDNSGDTNMTSTERLVALQKRQSSFAKLLPSSIHTIHLDGFPILELTRYALSGGVFVMTESTNKALRWISLTFIGQHAPVWEGLEFDDYIIDFAFSPEEDLLVVLSTATPEDDDIPPSEVVRKLHFYEMSTRLAHRGAREPTIIIPAAARRWVDLFVDICGPKVSILMDLDGGRSEESNHVLVYDWKRGALQMHLGNRFNYVTAIFLSPDIILLASNTGLDLWTVQDLPELWTLQDLPEEEEAERMAGPEVSLGLPNLPHNHTYEITRVESNPKGSNSPASQSDLFHSSFVDSSAMLNIRVSTPDGVVQRLFLIIPRCALLQQLVLSADRGQELWWAQWGPLSSRWVQADNFNLDWPTIICGQRCAFITPDRSVVLLDFNPYTRQRTLLEEANRNPPSAKPTTGRFVFMPSSELGPVDELAVFGAEGDSRLEYVAKKSLETTTWDGILMDEEWIVGINDTAEVDGRFSLDVWHFG
ncbi:hypothetical protein K438DRAFT_1830723 [Mycena galopus ATCC 62051]|nr:hypothetical protein K438DRAFT_1830723 [Mycena galopus ATCC 62051]